MSKTDKQILILIIIVLIGAGYAFNQYIIIPTNLANKNKQMELQANRQKLSLLKSESLSIVKEKEAVEKLRVQASELNNLTVNAVNTPQLIYDFYNSCKKYNIKGEDLAFQLADNNEVTNNAMTPAKPAARSNATEKASALLKLTIGLKVSGGKNQVQKYIKNLSTFTKRKINVKSINLSASISSKADTSAVPSSLVGNLQPNIHIVQATDQVTADIIFYQYIYNEGQKIEGTSNYDFYKDNTGLNDFSEMFK